MALAKGTPWWTALPPLLAVASVLVALLGGGVGPWLATLVLLAVTGLFLNFFRDPEREVADGVVSAADGKVTGIGEHDGRTRIVVFMSPLNVHVNRAPVRGTVKRLDHHPGGYVPAFRKESERNERMVWEFETREGDVFRMTQIAGTVARRIVPYVGVGVDVEKGERVGLIRFGSRVDIHLPDGYEPVVTVGQVVKAGETTLARRKEVSSLTGAPAEVDGSEERSSLRPRPTAERAVDEDKPRRGEALTAAKRASTRPSLREGAES